MSIDPAMAAVDTFYRDVEPAEAERRVSALRVTTAAIFSEPADHRPGGLCHQPLSSAPKIGRSALIGSSRWLTEPTPTSCDGPRATTHFSPALPTSPRCLQTARPRAERLRSRIADEQPGSMALAHR
jgi:hypothetical protein